MICKEGVKLFGLRPEMLFALRVAERVYESANIFQDMTDQPGARLVVTSACEPGGHSRGSLHYIGAAVDIRTRHAPKEDMEQTAGLIATALTDEFDVVLEDDHLHIEFQPKE
tara:strand:- start:454 stop:789 length:336 start_codon:yes stop_codon:yes gene_type:complete